MYKLQTLKNGLTLITIDLPHLESVTSLVAVGAGSRYENKKNNGVSHFLEHMFFKGSKKYPTTEIISTLVDGIGAVSNAATSKEYTFYYIKSAAKHIELACDVLASQLKESLFKSEEIEREKGVIIEEIRMYKDNPQDYVWELFDELLFGDQPIGRKVIGEEENIKSFTRKDVVSYMNSAYCASNMTIIFVGKIPQNIEDLTEKYFGGIKEGVPIKFLPYKSKPQAKAKVDIHFRETDQANLIFGVESFGTTDKRKYAAELLSAILGHGMSSRLWLQIRERRGLAYSVMAANWGYLDTGMFIVYSGMKISEIEEGIKVIREQLEKMVTEKVSPEELKKAKEYKRGTIAIRSESTNYLASHFAVDYVVNKEIETFEEYLKKIDKVTAEEIQEVAKELFQKNKYNLQIVGPFKDSDKFLKLLS